MTLNDDPQVSIVLLTHQRPDDLSRSLEHLTRLPERAPIIVVDNGSAPGAVAAVVQRFDGIELVRSECNIGAAGRNLGVERVRTPFVAFCDDDTWWAPGSLAHAVSILQEHPRLAVISARVLVGEQHRTDPTCERMARSPIRIDGLPGPGLIAFMAGAAVMRTQAYREAGGYEPRFFLGAEEALMGLELASRGWHMAYVASVVTHHHPSGSARDPRSRRIALARNRLWTAWLRLPWPTAWCDTRRILHEAAGQGIVMAVLLGALRGVAWAWSRRRVVPPGVDRMHRAVYGKGWRHEAPPAPLAGERLG